MSNLSTAANNYINGNHSDVKDHIFKADEPRQNMLFNPPEIVAARTMDIFEYLRRNRPVEAVKFSLWIRGMATR